MPVHNGAEFLAEALDAILAQTFGDFELIISDNASTDRTREICGAYAGRDSRIRLVHDQTNIGGARNHNRVLELSRGTYFKWCAHDDKIAPTYLERCVEALDADPNIVLCHSLTVHFRKAGETWRARHVPQTDNTSPRPHDRFHRVLEMGGWTGQIYGLMRTEAIRWAGGLGSYVGADRVVLVKLALLGGFVYVPEDLFFRRSHPGMSMRRYSDPRDRVASWDLTRPTWLFLPFWRRFLEFSRAVLRAPMSARDRLACLRTIASWLAGSKTRKGAWRSLARDLTSSAGRLLARPERSL